jgi:ankyrin repeat protein
MYMGPADHLIAAVLEGDEQRVRRAIAEDPSLVTQRNMFGVSALHAAVATGRDDLVAVLRSDDPLDLALAAELGDVDRVVRLLAASPEAVDALDARGSRPLHGAAYWGRADVVDELLRAGADPDAVTRDDFLRIPPLGAAVATTPGVPQPSDDEDVVLRIVRSLLERGADPGATRLDGMTPLHGAAWRGLARVVQELLDAGADPMARASAGPHAGQTAADTAMTQGHLVLAARLDTGAPDVASPYG